jgi:hypothetical protein
MTLLENLTFCRESLEDIGKQLAEYLTCKREAFPRFYFLANEELLAILSNSQDIRGVQKHMLKCFEGIKTLALSETLEVVGMVSPEGETVDFFETVTTSSGEKVRNVEDWMLDVETEM